MKNYLTASNGKLLGWTVERGSKVWLYRADGRDLGWYDANSNTTCNRNGSLVGRGNLLASLMLVGK